MEKILKELNSPLCGYQIGDGCDNVLNFTVRDSCENFPPIANADSA